MQSIGNDAGSLGRRFKSDRLATGAIVRLDVALVDQRVRRRRAGIGDEVQQAAQPADGVGRRLGAQVLQRANEGDGRARRSGRSVARRESLRASEPRRSTSLSSAGSADSEASDDVVMGLVAPASKERHARQGQKQITRQSGGHSNSL